MAGGHGYGDDDSELRSVVCARGKQRREWGPGGERRGAGGEGECVASPGVEEGGNQAGSGQGGSRRWPRQRQRPSATRAAYWRREDDRGGRLVGWAAPVGCQHRSWAGCCRQVSALLFPFTCCFLFFSSSVLN